MADLRFFTDEEIYGATATALRKAGYDAVSIPDTGRLGETDESQMQWAVSEGRVLVTFNVAHFAALHTRWVKEGRHHYGIVVSVQQPIGDFLRRLLHLAAMLDAEAMRDRLEFLSDWK